MTSKKISVAVIGYGHLGKWHCQKVDALPTSELKVIIDQDEERLKQAKLNHPHAEVTSDLQAVLSENKIEAYIIVSPTSSHYPLLKLIISHGKHVFCEKPFCSSLEEAKLMGEMIENQLKNKKIVIQVGHSERFHEAWEYIKKYQSFLDEPGITHIARVAPYKGRATDVDVVNDLMIHDLDLLYFLYQEKPVLLHTTGFKSMTDKWDYVYAFFNFPSGRTASITVSRHDVQEKREVTITNSQGHMLIDLFRQEFFFASGAGIEIEKKSFIKKDHLLLEQEAFFNSILNENDSIIGHHEGILAVELVDNVLQGLR